MISTQPVLMALSWLPAVEALPPQLGATATTPQETEHPAAATETVIACPLTGQQIPSCCCPVRN